MICLSPGSGKHRNSKGMQRHSIQHRASHSSLAGGALWHATFLEKSALFDLRIAHDDR